MVEHERQAWEAYFNASKGVATNDVTGIFRKTCRVFVWEHGQCGRGLPTMAVCQPQMYELTRRYRGKPLPHLIYVQLKPG